MVFDPERALWIPGKKYFSIPAILAPYPGKRLSTILDEFAALMQMNWRVTEDQNVIFTRMPASSSSWFNVIPSKFKPAFQELDRILEKSTFDLPGDGVLYAYDNRVPTPLRYKVVQSC